MFPFSKFIVHCSLFIFVTLFALRLDNYIGGYFSVAVLEYTTSPRIKIARGCKKIQSYNNTSIYDPYTNMCTVHHRFF